MKNFLIFLITTSLSFNTFANVASPLKKGDVAQFDGVLLDNEKATELRNDVLERDSLKRQIDIYKQLEVLSQTQLDKLLSNTKALNDELSKQRSPYDPYIWFGVGVLATGLSIYAAKKIID